MTALLEHKIPQPISLIPAEVARNFDELLRACLETQCFQQNLDILLQKPA